MTTLKLRIVAYAFIAALLPSSILGYLAYSHSLHVTQERFGQQLHGLAFIAARETERWLDQRLGDLRAFAALPVLWEALTGGDQTRSRVDVYLASLRRRFPQYRRLALADAEGNPISEAADPALGPAASPETQSGVRVLPAAAGGNPLLRLTIPVDTEPSSAAGFLVADLSLENYRHLLHRVGTPSVLYLVADGQRLLGARGPLPFRSTVPMAGEPADAGLGSALRYRDHRGTDVLGAAESTQYPGLVILAETSAASAFRELAKLRTRSLGVLGLMLGALVVFAYLFSLALVRPLNRLIVGARRVADGDLDVELPVARRDEVGYLSQVFNNMVGRLQESRRKVTEAQAQLLEQNRRLEELTVTDNLTGLYNRRNLTETLRQHLIRFRRNRRPFSVLMLDIDHFKAINDEHGHLAGDEVLKCVARLIAEDMRSVDYAARYGGEEFTIILFETARNDAWGTAQRIRRRIESERTDVQRDPPCSVTVSVGIAEVSADDVAPETLLQRADAALYEAKRSGRNRVCFTAIPDEAEQAPGLPGDL